VAFVGFVGGWTKQVLGPDALFLGAALAGGPVVESTHGKLHFTAPLTAITAAVVGVIASLALFFIAYIAYKKGATGAFLSQLDWVGLLIAFTAALALLRYKIGVIPAIAACALAGLAVRFTGWI